MPTTDRSFTVVIVPNNEASRSRSFVVNGGRARLVILSFGLLVVGAISLIGLSGSRVGIGERSQLENENRALRRQLASFDGQVEGISSTLERLLAYDAKVRQLTRVDEGVRAFGIGPLSELDGGALALDEPSGFSTEVGLSADLSERVQEVGHILTLSERAAGASEVSLQELRAYLEDRNSILRAYPSLRPTRGWVSSRFGMRDDPSTRQLKFHAGTDIAATHGTPIRSAADGVVTYAGWRRNYGRMVIVDHGYGLITRYAHASRLLVSEGERVRRGQTIARVGSTGR